MAKPFRIGPEKAKREELKTYKELGLAREAKTVRQRRKLSGGGARLLIGGDDPARPELIVARELYQKTRAEVLRDFLVEALDTLGESDLNREEILDHLSPRVERETYDRLARAHHHGPRLDAAFQRLHGRRPTAKERVLMPPPKGDGAVSYDHYRGGLVDEVLGQIGARHKHSEANYQTIWAELVGPQLAQESRLEKIVPESGVAYFRCTKAALSYALRTKADLPKRLSKALGVPVRQLRSM
jgi:Dna[CI] antecedent, DciA